jgi:hypothetical protein
MSANKAMWLVEQQLESLEGKRVTALGRRDWGGTTDTRGQLG